MSQDDFFEHDAIPVASGAAKDDFFEHDAVPVESPKPMGPSPLSQAVSAVGSAAHSAFDTVGDLAHSTSAHMPLADLGAKIAAHGYAATRMLHDLVSAPEQKKSYEDYLKEGLSTETASRAAAEQRSPNAWTAGKVLAPIESMATPIPGAGVKGALGIGARIASNAVLGGLDQGSRGLDNPDLINPEEAARGARVGAGVASAMEAALPIVGKLAGPAFAGAQKVFGRGADAVENVAERRAFKAAAGNQAKFIDEASKQGRVNQIGRDLLDEGVVGFGDNARAIADKARIAKGDAGNEISAALKSADHISNGLVDNKTIASKLREYAKSIGGAGNAATVDKINAIADAYEQRAPMSLGEAQIEKNSFKYRPGDPGSTFDKEANNRVKGIIGDEMEAGVGRADAMAAPAEQVQEPISTGTGETAGGPVTQDGAPILGEAEEARHGLEDYSRAKQRYGSFSTAAQAAEKLANRQEKNATFGLLPTITGAAATVAAIMHGNPALAIAAPVVGGAHKLAQTRGNATLAVSADKLSDILRSTPEFFGKFAAPLLESARRGNQSLAVTHYMLSQQEPEYSQLMQGKKP